MSKFDLRTYFNPNLSSGSYVPEALPSSAYALARQAGLSYTQIQGLASQQNLSFSQGALNALTADVNAGFNSQITDLNAGFNSQITDLNNSFNAQIDGLNTQLTQQGNQFATAQSQFNSQMNAQQARYQEQANQFANLQSAQVPEAERTAVEQPSTAAKEYKRASPLSSLAIVSGLGTQANPLSGLQLA